MAKFQRNIKRVGYKAFFCSFIIILICTSVRAISVCNSIGVSEYIRLFSYLSNYYAPYYNHDLNIDSLFVVILEKGFNKTRNSKYLANYLLKSLKVHDKVSNNRGILFELTSLKKGFYKKSQLMKLESLLDDSISYKAQYFYDNTLSKFTKPVEYIVINPYPSSFVRILTLQKIWNYIHYYYPYKEIIPNDYDIKLDDFVEKVYESRNATEFHQAILEYCSLIPDSHVTVNSYLVNKLFGYKVAPFDLGIIDNKVLITAVYGADLIGSKRISIGDEVTTINGIDIKTRISEIEKFQTGSNECSRLRRVLDLIRRSNDDYMLVGIRRANKSSEVLLGMESSLLDLPRHPDWNRKSIIKLDESTSLIYLENTDSTELEMFLTESSGIKNLIFDFRSTTNWVIPVLSKWFFAEKHVFANWFQTNAKKPGILGIRTPLYIGYSSEFTKKFHGNIFLLVDHNTQSQGEFQAMALQSKDGVITVGSQTSGADGNVIEIDLPGSLRVSFSGLGIEYPDHTNSQLSGVKLDHIIKITVQDVIDNNDPALNYTLKLINSKKP